MRTLLVAGRTLESSSGFSDSYRPLHEFRQPEHTQYKLSTTQQSIGNSPPPESYFADQFIGMAAVFAAVAMILRWRVTERQAPGSSDCIV